MNPALRTTIKKKLGVKTVLLALLGLILSACGLDAPTLAPQAVTPRVGQYQSFQVTTPGLTNRFLRHADGLGFTEIVNSGSADLLKKDATWKVVPGLADASCYSLESLNYPGSFLRHQASRVRLDRNDNSGLFARDATWCGRDGLSGTGISFESKNFPGRYLRHFNAEVWLAQRGGPLKSDTPNSFDQDASWNIYDPWVTGTGTGGGGNGGGSGGGGIILPPAPAGRINFRVLNQTNGAYPDAQVYWAILGYNPANERAFVPKPQRQLGRRVAGRQHRTGSPQQKRQKLRELLPPRQRRRHLYLAQNVRCPHLFKRRLPDVSRGFRGTRRRWFCRTRHQ